MKGARVGSFKASLSTHVVGTQLTNALTLIKVFASIVDAAVAKSITVHEQHDMRQKHIATVC
jgi:hypothetical protein